MGTPFPNPVVGGGGALVVPVIRSPDFDLATQTRWAIYADGSAYFFNITAAGSVTSNTVIVKGPGDGVFIYDGTPAAGSLILAMASEAGTDQWGNDYSGPGIALSVPGPGGSKNNIQVRPDLGAVLIYT